MDTNSAEEVDHFSELSFCIELYIDGVVNFKELVSMVQPLFRPTDYTFFINTN